MPLVLDASIVAEYLVNSAIGAVAAEHMAENRGDLHLPHLAVIETVSVLRGWVRRGEVTEHRAAAAIDDLADLPAQRWPGELLLARMWELRDNITAYDASYVALAELLEAELLTADQRLGPGLDGLSTCQVRAIAVAES